MSVVAANPPTLVRYADVAARLNDQLGGQSGALAGALRHFAASCTEYSTGIDDGLAWRLRDYSNQLRGGDERVRQVGQDVARADGSAYKPALPPILSPWLLPTSGLSLRLLRASTEWLRQGERRSNPWSHSALSRPLPPWTLPLSMNNLTGDAALWLAITGGRFIAAVIQHGVRDDVKHARMFGAARSGRPYETLAFSAWAVGKADLLSKGSLPGVKWLGRSLEFGSIVVGDFQKERGTRIASAIVVDARTFLIKEVLKEGVGEIGGAVGQVGGAAIGTMLWPGVGTVVGGYAGYVAGKWFADAAVDYVVDTTIGEGTEARERAITDLDQKVTQRVVKAAVGGYGAVKAQIEIGRPPLPSTLPVEAISGIAGGMATSYSRPSQRSAPIPRPVPTPAPAQHRKGGNVDPSDDDEESK